MRAKYVLSEVATGLWRNLTMTIAMMITMAVSLTMFGASLLLFWQVQKLQDYGSTYANGSATHSLTLYRHSSGAWVLVLTTAAVRLRPTAVASRGSQPSA